MEKVKPTLYVLAAGMGSRYGGLKQLDGVGPQGETIMDYSIYDAMRAGFGKVVFVIRHDFEKDFREKVLTKYEGHIDTEVVFQEIDKLPEGYEVPAGRTKPWGTNHAIMMAEGVIKEPFAVINADDFYGSDAFRVIADYLSDKGGRKGEYCMVGFKLGNTMTENGTVSRGVCTVDATGNLSGVTERTKIGYAADGTVEYTDAEGGKHTLEATTPVSMNLWGFTPDYFEYSDREFKRFLNKYIGVEKSEYYIPSVVDKLIKNGEAHVKVLKSDSQWFGVTYAADREPVMAKLASLHASGEYPSPLFDK